MDSGHGLSKLKPSGCRASAQGFSLVELIIALLVGLVLVGMAIPITQSAMASYRMGAAVSSITGAIQSARYQAIFQGCQLQVAFSSTTKKYQVSSEVVTPPAVPPACAGAFTNVGGAIPLGSTAVTLPKGNVTLQFHPNGQVQAAAGALNNIVVSYQGKSTNITVSNFGSIKTCNGTSPCP
jgi:prepilin-type N-terminal cleavage/methylation domain-containing protein